MQNRNEAAEMLPHSCLSQFWRFGQAFLAHSVDADRVKI
jgi:hypothetical protein